MLSDYAGNGGDTDSGGNPDIGLTPVPNVNPRINRGPNYTGAIVPQDLGEKCAPNTDWKNPLVAMKNITDGSSHTMLLAEKYVAANAYEGGSWGDNFGWHAGNEWEGVRFSRCTPAE